MVSDFSDSFTEFEFVDCLCNTSKILNSKEISTRFYRRSKLICGFGANFLGKVLEN